MCGTRVGRCVLGAALLLCCIWPLSAQLPNLDADNEGEEAEKGKYVIELLIPGDPGDPEDWETTVGAFVAVNDDDDDEDGVADKDDDEVLLAEDDLLPVCIRAIGDMPANDSVTVSWSNDEKLAVWKDELRLEFLQSGGSITFGEFLQGDGCKELRLYLEGLAASDALRDIQMTAVYNKEGTNWGDEIRVTVMKVDATVTDLCGAVPETTEETTGAFILINDDDDDTNKKPDNDNDDQPVNGEDDLRLLTISWAPSTLDAGELKLEAVSGGGKLKIWTHPDKRVSAEDGWGEVTPPRTWDIPGEPPTTQPIQLYIEGYQTSDQMGDVLLRLTYRVGDEGPSLEDQIRVTVLKLDLDIDSDNTDWWQEPQRSLHEESVETGSPKLLMVNVDDDDGDQAVDNADDAVNGANDAAYDMSKMIAEVRPAWDAEQVEVVLAASSYNEVRVFAENQSLLLGPGQGHNQQRVLQAGGLTNGVAKLLVEGVQTGNVAFTLVYRWKKPPQQVIWQDQVGVTVVDNLSLAPLVVPDITQHKDTAMLCCDGFHNNAPLLSVECALAGAHAWDSVHPGLGCKHCGGYCTRASVAMVSAYYGNAPKVQPPPGQPQPPPYTGISQDRISFACSRYLDVMGTSWGGDLGHDMGLAPHVHPQGAMPNARSPMEFALNGAVIDLRRPVTNQEVTDFVVSMRPTLVCIDTNQDGWADHTLVIAGTRIGADAAGNPRLEWWILDPSNVRDLWHTPADLVSVLEACAPAVAAVEAGISPVSDEGTIAMDSDQDGVVDFDEVQGRFNALVGVLDPNDDDSDNDGTPDKDQVQQAYGIQ